MKFLFPLLGRFLAVKYSFSSAAVAFLSFPALWSAINFWSSSSNSGSYSSSEDSFFFAALPLPFLAANPLFYAYFWEGYESFCDDEALLAGFLPREGFFSSSLSSSILATLIELSSDSTASLSLESPATLRLLTFFYLAAPFDGGGALRFLGFTAYDNGSSFSFISSS